MIWNNKKLVTIGDVLNAVCDIALRESYEDAQDFMNLYEEDCVQRGGDMSVVRSNIGYVAGYCDQKTADRIYRVFSVSHPIFGRSHPSAEEAFQAGMRAAERRKGGEREQEGA